MKDTNSMSSQDFQEWADQNEIEIHGGPPTAWDIIVEKELRENTRLYDSLAKLPDQFIPWQYWALLLLMTMIAIIGLVT